MNAWAAVANIIFAGSADSWETRTIALKFAAGAHGDAYPFDGPGGILAHTFYPVPINSESIAGDIHLDADENWHAGSDLDIYSVVLHELGHAIGLGHSDKPGDVMYPYYKRGMPLSANDMGAAQALYGAPANAPEPPAAISAPPAPLPSPVPLSLTLNPVTPPGQASQLTLSGTVSGGAPPLSLQYQTDHGYSGKAAVGSSGLWTASGVGLVTGSNTITVTAYDAAQKTASQSATVTRIAATPVGTPVSVRITTPAAAVAATASGTIALAGTASGGAGITQVIWQTPAGATGPATGTDHWLANNIPLLTGTNTVVVRAYDSTGSMGWATEIVVRH
jgi:hypothetical protein